MFAECAAEQRVATGVFRDRLKDQHLHLQSVQPSCFGGCELFMLCHKHERLLGKMGLTAGVKYSYAEYCSTGPVTVLPSCRDYTFKIADRDMTYSPETTVHQLLLLLLLHHKYPRLQFCRKI